MTSMCAHLKKKKIKNLVIKNMLCACDARALACVCICKIQSSVGPRNERAPAGTSLLRSVTSWGKKRKEEMLVFLQNLNSANQWVFDEAKWGNRFLYMLFILQIKKLETFLPWISQKNVKKITYITQHALLLLTLKIAFVALLSRCRQFFFEMLLDYLFKNNSY